MKFAVASGLVSFLITLSLALLRRDRFSVDDTTIIGGKRDVVPGIIGMLAGFGVTGFAIPAYREIGISMSILGVLTAAVLFYLFGKVRS